MLGLTVHPVTGEIWENENGPLGGDEVNILKDLRQRIRTVRQGPDGLLYVLTDQEDGAVLRVETE